MQIKEIKKIIQLMKDNDLTEFEMEDQGVRIAIKRGRSGEPVVLAASAAPAAAMAPGAAASPAPQESGLAEIKSPMVGTFYRSTSPGSGPLVSVGDQVEEDTVVCIIEAMKVMNEIKAEKKGTVREIVAENATPVEFGQTLFKLAPL